MDFITRYPAFIYAIQLLFAECILIFLLPKKKNWLLAFIISITIFIGVSFIIPDLILGGILYVPLFVFFLIVGSSLYFILDLKINGLIFCVTCLAVMQHTAECLTMAVRFSFGVTESHVMWNGWSFICYVVVYTILTLVLKSRLKDIELKSWKVILISLLVFFGIFSLRNLAAIVCNQWQVENYMRAIYNAYATLCCVLSLAFMFSSNRSEKLNKDNELMMQLLKQEQAHYERLVSNQDTINRKCHDLKYRIAAMKNVDSQVEKDEIISRLEQDVLIYEGIAKTGNVALDYTISDKYYQCIQNNVKFTYIVNGSSLSFMKATDIYVLFGNALDNALECVLNYKDEEKRIIALHVTSSGNMVRIHVENYCEEDVSFVDGLPQTTKKDKTYHGIGFKSMKYIVKQYGGYINASKDCNLFALDIVFPFNDGQKKG